MTSQRSSKVKSIDEAAALIADGSTIAVGGLSYFGAPMSLVRALVRRGAKNLTVVTSAVSGLQADMLIAAGCVTRIISPYVALEELGLAPNFRRAVERGDIQLEEIGEAFLAFGLKAGASGAPFYALPRQLAAGDTVQKGSLYRWTTDPFTGEEVLCVPALRPDWAILHAQEADEFGNLRYLASAFMDPLLARAARRVIASCDQLVSNDLVRSEPEKTTIPAMMVHHIVPVQGGAHPTASEPLYGVDRDHVRLYMKASKTSEGLSDYMTRYVSSSADPQEYVTAVGGLPACREVKRGGVNLADPPSVGEIMAVVMAHSLEDGIFVGVGTGCWEVAAGVRLAQLTHAPNLSFSMGGTAGINTQLDFLPLSVNSADALMRAEAIINLEDLFDLELNGTFDVMFASGLQIDQFGNLNLACIGDPKAPKLRGPGTVGLEFTPCVNRVIAFFRKQNRHTFVEKVDFISGPGYLQGRSSRNRFGLSDETGPFLVVTDLGVYDYDPVSNRMRVKSLHPGVTIETVTENTGFELVLPDSIQTTPVPTEDELNMLRTRIDCQGLLKTLV